MTRLHLDNHSLHEILQIRRLSRVEIIPMNQLLTSLQKIQMQILSPISAIPFEKRRNIANFRYSNESHYPWQ
jgi:hypothetical protein